MAGINLLPSSLLRGLPTLTTLRRKSHSMLYLLNRKDDDADYSKEKARVTERGESEEIKVFSVKSVDRIQDYLYIN